MNVSAHSKTISAVIPALFFLSSGLTAADLTWSGAAGNNEFFDENNWAEEASPGTGDTLTFNQNGSIVANFPDDPVTTLAIEQLIFTATNNAANFRALTIDLNGGTLNSTAALPVLQVNVTDGISPSQVLTFRDGTVTAPSWTTSSGFSTSQGWSEVRLDNVNLDLGTGTLDLAIYNRTDFYIESGSVVSAGASRFGVSPNASAQSLANVYVDGSGAQLLISDRLMVGAATGSGEGNVFVQNGGYMYVDDNLQLARNYGAATASSGTGRVTVDGATSELEIGKALYVGGGNGGSTSTATFTLLGDGNGHATFTNGGSGSAEALRVFYTTKGTEEDFDVFYGRLTMDGGTLDLTGNATFEKGAVYEATLGSAPGSAPLTVDGNLALSANNTTAVANTIDFDGARLELNLSAQFNPAVEDFFPLISYEGSRTGNFIWWDASLAEYVTLLDEATFTLENFEFMIQYNVASGDQSLVGLSVTAIPEPASAAFILMAAAAAVVVARRRRHTAIK